MKKLGLFLILLILIAAGGYFYLSSNPDALLSLVRDMERHQAGLEPQEITVNDEIWPYLEGGPEDGPEDVEILVLLHGFGAEKDHWTRMAAHLTDRYHVIAPDLPGFGEAARHDDWVYDMPSQMPRLNDFLVAKGLELKRFHIGGSSMGGNLAAYYAANYSHRIISLAVFNSSGVATVTPSELDEARERGENPLLVESVEDFDRMMNFMFVEPPTIPAVVKAYYAEKAVENRPFLNKIYTDYEPNRRGWLEQYLPSIENLPVLILWGEQDRVTHVSSIENMTPLLNNETVVIMPNVGHLPMLEKPEETATHYRDFLDAAGFQIPTTGTEPAAADPSEPVG